jgi:hypothetical protein
MSRLFIQIRRDEFFVILYVGFVFAKTEKVEKILVSRKKFERRDFQMQLQNFIGNQLSPFYRRANIRTSRTPNSNRTEIFL